MRPLSTALVTLALATAVHLDWHAARPVEHHLSLGWRWHALLAIPVFALTAWYVLRAWPTRLIGASVAIIGIASLLAAVVEPAWEYYAEDAPAKWAFGSFRLATFATFVATGIVTYVAVLAVGRRAAWRTPQMPS